MHCQLLARPRVNPLSIGLLLAFGLLSVSATLCGSVAQAAGIIATDPITNQVGVDLDAEIEVTYASPISSTTVTTHTFVVQGMQSGARDGAFDFGDAYRRVTMDPAANFFPGEVVRVSATGGISDTGGSAVTPYQWQFTAGPVFDRHFGGFVDVDAGLLEVAAGSVAWGDYDGDGDLDILVTGAYYDSGYTQLTKLYRNDGGEFVGIETGLTAVWDSSVAWGDYDRDGDLDILLAGGTGRSCTASVYRNDEGAFTDIGAGLTGVCQGSVAWGDYDNDGDLDILVSGMTGSNDPVSRVYRNDGGSFIDIEAGLIDVWLSSVAWGDYDNDGDLDILLTGVGEARFVSQVLRNDGGSFNDIGAGLPEVAQGSAAWGDYDNDGDLDIILTGSQFSNGLDGTTGLYRNDGGLFAEIELGLPGVYQGAVAWGDFDNDGELDILLTGTQDGAGSGAVAGVYRNDGGTFVAITGWLPAVVCSSVAWGDYDGNDDLDILLSGYTGSRLVTRVYANEDYVGFFPVMYNDSASGLSDQTSTPTRTLSR